MHRPIFRALPAAQRGVLRTPTASAATVKRFFSRTRPARLLAPPINIPKWVSENSHMLQPPVNNYLFYNDAITVMIVGGPNSRSDYHINETAEWFHQHKGTLLLKIVDDGQFRDIYVNEGDMFILPPNTPHCPVRFAGSVGIVLEQKRPADSMDKIRWYCQECSEMVHEVEFHCTDLGTQIKGAVEAFKVDTEARTCKNCGTLCDMVHKPKA